MSTPGADRPPDVDVYDRALAGAPGYTRYGASARRVLAVAAALFHHRGAADTSIRDITRACGLSPGAIYRHFDSKDALLYAVVDLGHERMETRLADALAGAGASPAERVTAFVRAYVTGHLVNPELAQLSRREYLHLSPERRDAIVQRRRALRADLAGLLAGGAAAGELDVLGGAQGATRAAVMLLDLCSRTSEWYHADRDRPPDGLADLYVAAALRLVGARAR